MNDVFLQNQLVLAFNDDFKIQPSFGVPMLVSDLNARHPQINPTFSSTLRQRREIRDCKGEYILKRKITSKITQFTIGFYAIARTAAGWFALALGAAANPTGTPADETQTLTNDGDGGTFKLRFNFEGLDFTTAAIDFDATAAEVETALESLENIGAGNIAVSGASLSAGLTITGAGKLAKANLPLFEVADDTTTNGTAAIAAGTNGANYLIQIARNDTNKPLKISAIEGFEENTGGAKLYQDLIVGSVAVSCERFGILTVTITAYGSADYTVLPDYEMPVCSNAEPVYFEDCRLKIGADWITDDLLSFGYTYESGFDPNDPDNFKFYGGRISELQRGNRVSTWNLGVRGNDKSPIYVFAENEDSAFAATELHCGVPGERFSIFAPNVQFQLDDQSIQFSGNNPKSFFNLTGNSAPDGSNIVDRVEYRGADNTAFLQVSE